jgi:ribosomal protein S18 acetylase RimI-like enzyme
MHLRRVSHVDLPAFATVVASAMWADEVTAYTSPYKNQYPLSNYRHILYRVSKRFYSGQFLFLVVSDPSDSSWTGTTDEVVLGYSCYSTTVPDVIKPCPGGWLGNAFERQAVDAWGNYISLFRLNRSADPVAERYFRRLIETVDFSDYFESLPAAHRDAKGDQHWELELLGTAPQFRRRGVGKMALSWGFERAEENDVPLVLLASITGNKLYSSLGFKSVKKYKMLPESEEEAFKMGKACRERLAKEDYGLGIGKGIEWHAMVWEPDGMRQRGRANKAGTAEGV